MKVGKNCMYLLATANGYSSLYKLFIDALNLCRVRLKLLLW